MAYQSNTDNSDETKLHMDEEAFHLSHISNPSFSFSLIRPLSLSRSRLPPEHSECSNCKEHEEDNENSHINEEVNDLNYDTDILSEVEEDEVEVDVDAAGYDTDILDVPDPMGLRILPAVRSLRIQQNDGRILSLKSSGTFIYEGDYRYELTPSNVTSDIDLQGIFWNEEHTRESFLNPRRSDIILQSKQMYNFIPKEKIYNSITDNNNPFFTFFSTSRKASPILLHPQLRHLVCALSENDVIFPTYQHLCYYSINKHKTIQLKPSFLDLAPDSSTYNSPFPLSNRLLPTSLDTNFGLILIGDMNGALVLMNLNNNNSNDDDEKKYTMLSQRTNLEAESFIVNHVTSFRSKSGVPYVVTSNNDNFLRVTDLHTYSLVSHYGFEWCVNHTAVSPMQPSLAVVLGDTNDCLLFDLLLNKPIMTLSNHTDFGFCAAFHPLNKNIVTTGGQDGTLHIWDIRKSDKPIYILGSKLAPIRSCKFTSDGKYLAFSEDMDYIHIYDTFNYYSYNQSIDLIGDIAGFDFAPSTTTCNTTMKTSYSTFISDYSLFIGISFQNQVGNLPLGCILFLDDRSSFISPGAIINYKKDLSNVCDWPSTLL